MARVSILHSRCVPVLLEVIEKGELTQVVYIQDTLMVSYLANLVRSQAEVTARLALVA
jgi:translation initiation factor 3 subunit F